MSTSWQSVDGGTPACPHQFLILQHTPHSHLNPQVAAGPGADTKAATNIIGSATQPTLLFYSTGGCWPRGRHQVSHECTYTAYIYTYIYTSSAMNAHTYIYKCTCMFTCATGGCWPRGRHQVSNECTPFLVGAAAAQPQCACVHGEQHDERGGVHAHARVDVSHFIVIPSFIHFSM